MGILSWLIFAALVGWVASLITGDSRGKIYIKTIVIGGLVVFAGGFLLYLVEVGEGELSLGIAVLGVFLLCKLPRLFLRAILGLINIIVIGVLGVFVGGFLVYNYTGIVIDFGWDWLSIGVAVLGAFLLLKKPLAIFFSFLSGLFPGIDDDYL